jgi:hypothetical protein
MLIELGSNNMIKKRLTNLIFNSFVLVLVFCLVSFQHTTKKIKFSKSLDQLRIKILKENKIGKTFEFDFTKNKNCNKSKFKYLGIVNINKNLRYKLLTSFYVFGSSCRGTSHLLIYNLENKYIGNYYLEMPINLPDTLIDNCIVYQKNDKNYQNRKGTKISFKKGLPKQFYIPFYHNSFQFSKSE